MNILVVGASGFVGSSLVDFISKRVLIVMVCQGI